MRLIVLFIGSYPGVKNPAAPIRPAATGGATRPTAPKKTPDLDRELKRHFWVLMVTLGDGVRNLDRDRQIELSNRYLGRVCGGGPGGGRRGGGRKRGVGDPGHPPHLVPR